MANTFFEDLLIKRGLTTQEQIDEAHQKIEADRAEGIKTKIGDALIDLGYIDETAYAKTIAEQVRLPFVDIDKYDISLAAANKIPVGVAKKYTILAIAELDDQEDDNYNIISFSHSRSNISGSRHKRKHHANCQKCCYYAEAHFFRFHYFTS